jgi:hypothetical protein
MAKTKTTITRYVATAAPKAKAAIRRVGSAGAQLAKDEKHTFTALLAAAASGYVKGAGMTVPYVDALGLEGTYGLVAWGIARYTRNRTAEHVATGLLSVAAARWGETMGRPGGGAATRGDDSIDY